MYCGHKGGVSKGDGLCMDTGGIVRKQLMASSIEGSIATSVVLYGTK
jgi:hypothetical protein